MPVPPADQPPGVTLPGEQPGDQVPGDPGAGVGAEPTQPVPPQAPPEGPVSDATTNENPVLPHTAQAGAARAHATFLMAIDIGTNPEDPAAALAQIVALMQAMLADVVRFVPAAMQQTAADQVQAVADTLG